MAEFFTQFHTARNDRTAQVPRAPKGTPLTRVLISLGITLLFGAVYFYFTLPALNFRDREFYNFLTVLCVVWTVCMVILGGTRPAGESFLKYNLKRLPSIWLIAALSLTVLVGTVVGWVGFRSRDYAKLLETKEGDFAAEVTEISWDHIPMLDSTRANKLANRKLGELSDLVSQFGVDENSAQINYRGTPVRVIYLDYDSFFKWFNNRSDGIPAYMIVDMVTQEVEVVRLEEGIKYSPSEYFNRNITRYLRLNYPTKMFNDVNFEIDEDGTPWWIASVVEKKIGLFGGRDIVGAALVNAVTGETEYLPVSEVPTWVDRVFSAELIIEQYDYYGVYHNGFFNSIFGQKGCTETTDGYNYIAQNDDVWLYTGITSVSGDRGNIGFVLVNQRTKEARYYSCAGAEEYSAMDSAEGAVQQYAYQATFPLLLNLGDQPTYFMALKDAAGLVKMYALVNVQQYQIVSVGNTVEQAVEAYELQLANNGIAAQPEPDKNTTLSISGRVTDVRSAVIGGNTCFYVALEGESAYFALWASEFPEAVLLNVGDTVTVKYEAAEDPILPAVDFVREK